MGGSGRGGAGPEAREGAADRGGDRGAETAKPRLRLRLFVAGNAPNSAQARDNLRALLRRHDITDLDLEIVDCLLEPLRALEEGIFVTPTLLKLAPPPGEIIVGTLASEARVARALGLALDSASEAADD